MVEFALILFPLLLLVVGVIQFGIGLNYWLDMQRIANQGARWAAVNNWPPDCQRDAATCTNYTSRATHRRAPTRPCRTRSNARSSPRGLQKAVDVEVCYPNAGNKDTGDPVKVRLEADFTFVPIMRHRHDSSSARTPTMRLEQSQTAAEGGKITGDVGATC